MPAFATARALLALGAAVTLLPVQTTPGFAVHAIGHAEKVERERVTNRKPNPLGKVPIIMYHSIGDNEKYMVRSYKHFRGDLERLYKMGFRPVTLAEYVDGKFDIGSGSSPVVLTFDDSRESQFRLTKDGQVAENCFVGVWQEFAKTHPTFPVKGTFFVLPNGPFGKSREGKIKVKKLLSWGCEIASHTFNHRFLNKLPDSEVMREFAISYDWLKKIGVHARTLALPFGVNPKNHELLHGFDYKGKHYQYDAICMAGDFPARSPSDPKVNFLRLPRIEASPASDGLDVWLDQYQAGKVKALVVP